MTALTLRLREPMLSPVDVSHLVPHRLACLDLTSIGDVPLWRGRNRLRVTEVFELSGDNTDDLVFEAELPVLSGVGYGMERGRITVRGPVGSYAGRKMQGGELRILGDAGPYVGSGLGGGLIVVEGHAGDFLAAALPGERYGMEGGTVLVKGNAGARVADRMRRGTVLIEGAAGDWCGARLRAGTLGVLGRTGTGLGSGMRRGTILLVQQPEIPSLFRDNGRHDLTFLEVMIRSWRNLEGRFSQLQVPNGAQRFLGDRSVGGQGELLLLSD